MVSSMARAIMLRLLPLSKRATASMSVMCTGRYNNLPAAPESESRLDLLKLLESRQSCTIEELHVAWG